MRRYLAVGMIIVIVFISNSTFVFVTAVITSSVFFLVIFN